MEATQIANPKPQTLNLRVENLGLERGMEEWIPIVAPPI